MYKEPFQFRSLPLHTYCDPSIIPSNFQIHFYYLHITFNNWESKVWKCMSEGLASLSLSSFLELFNSLVHYKLNNRKHHHLLNCSSLRFVIHSNHLLFLLYPLSFLHSLIRLIKMHSFSFMLIMIKNHPIHL